MTTGNDLKSDVVGIDGIISIKASATGEYYFRKRTPETGAEVRCQWRLRAVRRDAEPVPTWEAAFRYGTRGQQIVGNDNIDEIRGGQHYYRRHTHRNSRADVGQLSTGSATAGTKRKDVEFACRRSSF